jgi:Na+/proline symporter
MLPNIAAVMIGYMYALLIIYPFMYSLDFKSPYDYLKRRYANRECVKLVCVCLAMFYYFSFASLYLWGCAAIINILVPDVMSIGVANIMLGLYSTSGSVLGGFVQSTRANIVQFLTVFIGILAAMYLTLVDQVNKKK